MRRAFTLIELLVVIVIIVALVGILVPTLGRVQETSRRAVCAANLKTQGESIANYASSNKDALPVAMDPSGKVNSAGLWLHDEPNQFAEMLLNPSLDTTNGSVYSTQHKAIYDMPSTSERRWFYCPSNYVSKTSDTSWRFGGINGNYKVLGYTYMNDRRDFTPSVGARANYPDIGSQLTQYATNTAVTPGRTYPPVVYRSTYATTMAPADSELALDEILTADYGLGAWWANKWDQPPVSSVSGLSTSHMQGKYPGGANVLAFDGHVAWRTFPRSINDRNKVVGIAIGKNRDIFVWIPNP